MPTRLDIRGSHSVTLASLKCSGRFITGAMDCAKNQNAMKLKAIFAGMAIQAITTAALIKLGMEISTMQQLLAGVFFVCLSFIKNFLDNYFKQV